jgi:hypothetical protein
MEGLDLNQISTNEIDVPRILTSSVSGMFSLISSDISQSTYFRVSAYDIHGSSCSSNALYQFYHFSLLVENGKQIY